MHLFVRLVPALACLLMVPVMAQSVGPLDEAPPVKKKKPKVEVVFVLDTTGSMSGLIDAAKNKIWSICNQIVGGNPTPDLKVGLVAYRDKGDDYVTKVFDLTDDLDAIHGHLKKFTAGGGGDLPEDVNKALSDAVYRVKWSEDKKTLRIIFLVGDAPPHMDYKQTQYPDICRHAVERGIIINAIQCGNNADCTKHWKEIAAKSEGVYSAIAQDGGPVVAVRTEFDARLATINRELTDTVLVYGRGDAKKLGAAKMKAAAALPPGAAADRAGFAGRVGKGGGTADFDLLEAVKEKKADLSKIKEAELPDQLRALKTDAERKAFLDKTAATRAALQKEAAELTTKRDAVIQAEMKKNKNKDSFDNNVLDTLRKQAKKFDIKY